MVHRRAISAILTALFLLFYSMALPELSSGGFSYAAPQAPVSSAKNAGADIRCDQLADSPNDPARIGNGVPFDQINVGEALPPCEQAANQLPPRPRYQFVYGRVLEAAQRYSDAAKQYSAADLGGDALASYILGALYEDGNGVLQ